uniref:Aminopeptidase n=3 Tax=Hirondellea gigas TaxID=1518452 RepID=A0A6A7G5G9_9CRUS
MVEEFTRLSDAVVPRLYSLLLDINFETSSFSGVLDVAVEVKQETKTVTLNSRELKFLSSPVLKSQDGVEVKSNSTTTNEKLETVSFEFPEAISVGKYELHIEFEGLLEGKLCGLYESQYISTIDGSTKRIATTQFEATDARRCFPCWDEPAIKAVFQLTLNVPSNLRAISNTPILDESTLKDERKLVKFDKTPIMSTYLVAIVVGEFDFISTFVDEVEIRVYTAVGNAYQATFALDVAAKGLKFFTEYFEIPYALAKVDLIAIPDFSAGAMENWGLITYRETRLLCDPESDSLSSKIDKAGTICHELVHMWFGNLVTMEWWTHLWLNEGFARFLQFLAVEDQFPEWKMWDNFVNNVHYPVLISDSMESSHPIEIPVKDPEEIKEIFDGISYAKGGSILRMLNNYLTPEVFRQGIVHYLKRFSYRNTQTEDLWQALSEISKVDVKSFMEKWTSKIGYPVVTVEEIDDSKDEISLRLTQSRFLANGKKASDDTIWSINVVMRSPNGEQKFLLAKETDVVTLPRSWNDSWIKINYGHYGFFRVSYPDSLLQKLMDPISLQILPCIDRLGLQEDCFALAAAGKIPITSALEILKAYQSENDPNVVSSICSCLNSVRRLHSGQIYGDTIDDLINRQFEGLYRQLGFEEKEGEPVSITKLRTMVLSALSRHPDVIAEARKRFKAFIQDPEKNKIPGDRRGLIYSLAVKYDGEEAYNAVLDLYDKTPLQQEKQRCMSALAKATDPKLLDRTLEWSLSADVRPNTAYVPVITVARTSYSYQTGWLFVLENWQRFYDKFPTGMKDVLGHVVLAFASNFTSMKNSDEIRDFFEKNPFSEGKTKIAQALELITVNSERLQREKEPIERWLNDWKSKQN